MPPGQIPREEEPMEGPPSASAAIVCERGGRSPSHRQEAEAYSCHPENGEEGGVLGVAGGEEECQ